MRDGSGRHAKLIRGSGKALVTSRSLEGSQGIQRRHTRSGRIYGHRSHGVSRRPPMRPPILCFYLSATGISLPSACFHSKTTKPGCLMSPLASYEIGPSTVEISAPEWR